MFRAKSHTKKEHNSQQCRTYKVYHYAKSAAKFAFAGPNIVVNETKPYQDRQDAAAGQDYLGQFRCRFRQRCVDFSHD
jgi:hypothetical protein